MPETLPKFDSPPVVETVLSVQFARLAGFSTAKAGWFWKGYLSKVPGPQWNKIVDAPRLEDQFEKFSEADIWNRSVTHVLFPAESQRTQIIRADEQRMIQVQDSRFVLNWQKQCGTYPSYESLQPEFWDAYGAFKKFTNDAELGAIEPNQWEMTYVNQIPKGNLWQSVRDWPKIIPSLTPPVAAADTLLESRSFDAKFVVSDNQGRLYIALRHARTSPPSGEGEEVLGIQLTARGPLSGSGDNEIKRGFDLGHRLIVETFAAMTSPMAHKHWKRRA